MSFLDFHAPEADPGPSPRVRRRRGLAGLAVLAVAVAVLLGAAAYGVSRLVPGAPPDYRGVGHGSLYVHIPTGASLTEIGQLLTGDGVVASVGAFVHAAEGNRRSIGIEPGFYRLRLQMSAAAALAVLVNPADLVRDRVTVPEGTSLKDLLPLLARRTTIGLASLQAAAADPGALGLPGYAQHRVEGFLFPATYEVPPGTTAVALLRMMVARFEQAAAAVHLVSGAAALHRTPLQVVIIASILERESASPADAAKVAEVFYNRLRVGLPLGSEFTVAYSGNDPASPYNTYTHTGFPPGPYDSPGQATLTAALHPTPGPWLYFVTLPDGRTLFASSYAGFQAARRQCLAQGGCR